MARGRMLSKDISLDEKVDALSDDTARLLFTWLIPHLDCEGRMYGDAKIFKSIVAPRRNYSLPKVEKILTEMERLGLIVRYLVDGNQFLFAPNFEKHQIGLRKDKETKSKIPLMDGTKTELRRSNDGVSPPQEKGSRREKKFKFKRKEVEGDIVIIAGKKYSKDWLQELREEFSDIYSDEELKKFTDYWTDGRRTLRNPKLALRNWMIKAREIKKDKQPEQYDEIEGLRIR